jgi:hypothetical protein
MRLILIIVFFVICLSLFSQNCGTTNRTLAWDASSSIPSVTNAFDYVLWVGTNCGQYFTNYDAGTNLNITVSNLSLGVKYHYAVTVTDTNANITSDYSTEIMSLDYITPPTEMHIVSP